MVKYLSGELHSNGETVKMETPADAAALRANFNANWFRTSDGTTEYGVTAAASAFAKLTIDQTALTFTKPNCDNYVDCPDPAAKGGDVTVKYVDQANMTTEIATGLVISGNVGDSYTTEQKVIAGYTFAEVQGAASGKITAQPQTVTYVYTEDE